MASSSSTSIVLKSFFKFDVFLSFRGEDTRKTFVDHLYRALEERSIITYKDDEKIEKGERISDQLIRSIEESKYYIIVFSQNYASSSWCLDELAKIMECQRLTDHTAYPVFYDVEPTDIRKQTGPVKRAFAKHRNQQDAEKWRDALKEAAGLAGWELKTTTAGYEAKFIQKIVEVISLELSRTDLRFDGKLVGMEARVKDFVSSLEIEIDDDVRMIGIKGMGGIGKTTLAKAIFNKISIWFEGSSFVDNVREISNDPSKGLKSLQEKLLSDILKVEGISVKSDCDVKRRLSGKKVLLVLDDVDHIDQLEALAGEPNWFKPGSRIIITTRDKQVLLAHRVHFISDVNLLSPKEAMCLFSRYAFGTKSPIQGYEELSKEVVCYAAGLPLTLKVLGSELCCNSDIDVWKDVLERLKTIPLQETLKKLELSYIALDNDCKEIFLDVACMLKGWRKGEAIRVLESCNYHAKHGLNVLEKKSLISISDNGCLHMHDHIEEMGTNIVRRLHPNEPHKHSRLWIKEEIEVILANDLGTEATKCIDLWNNKLHPATIFKGLRKMKGLRFLHVIDVSGDWDDDLLLEDMESCVLDGLQYLNWVFYPLTCLPKCFQVNKIVSIQMFASKIIQLWEGGETKVLDKLTHMDLSGSKLRTLELGPTPNLEKLILNNCSNLMELRMHVETPKLKFLNLSNSCHLRIIHLGHSPNLEVLLLHNCGELEEIRMPVGNVKLKSLNLFHHPKLRTLDLSRTLDVEKLHIYGCGNLVELHMPTELKFLLLKHSSLRTLNLSQCRNLEEIVIEHCMSFDSEELIMPVESLKLTSLKLNDSNIRTLDLAMIPNLQTLYLREYEPLVELQFHALCSLQCLRELTLWGSFAELPEDLHQLELLEKLNLSYAKIRHLPNSISMLKHLKVVDLRNCYFLEQLPEDIGQLQCLEILILNACVSLRDIPNSICLMKHLQDFRLKYCLLVEKLPEELGSLNNLKFLDIQDSGISHLPPSISRLKGLCVEVSMRRPDLYGFTFTSIDKSSIISAKCYI